MNKVYLLPGKFFASREPTEITTILGSCVAIAIFDPGTRIGGMNHFLLPGSETAEHQTARYGVFATRNLVKDILRLGANPKTLSAKIYGGASVLGEMSGALDVGRKNIELAEKELKALGIPIIDRHLGGESGCRVVMNTEDFSVKHKWFESEEVSPDVSGFAKLNAKQRCKVLIVDDSATVRTLFQNIFTKHGLVVVGAAANAFEAREMISKVKPDVMTLDIEMPMMSGVAFLEKVMKHFPIPTVMVSSLGSQGEAAMRALQLGAVEFIQKPSQYEMGDLQKLGEILVDKVRAAANIRVKKVDLTSNPDTKMKGAPASLHGPTSISVIGISGNSGSHGSLEKMFAGLPSDTPPVLVACSTVTSFLKEYILDLKKKYQHLSFEAAAQGTVPRVGNVYFSPAGHHLKISGVPARFQLEVAPGRAYASQMPSGTVLFESLAAVLPGTSVGVLLSGFGNDGVEGLARLQACKSLTLVENPAQLSFPFAPQAAVNQGVADEVLEIQEIPSAILKFRNRRAA
jgi:two-component system chemotaxis response regulator CheB